MAQFLPRNDINYLHLSQLFYLSSVDVVASVEEGMPEVFQHYLVVKEVHPILPPGNWLLLCLKYQELNQCFTYIAIIGNIRNVQLYVSFAQVLLPK